MRRYHVYPGPHSNASRRAMTVVELLVVIALVIALASVLAAVALPRMRSGALDEAQQQIRTVMADAQADAQQRGVAVRVVARSFGAGQVSIEARALDETAAAIRDEINPVPVPGQTASPRRPFQAIRLPRGVIISDTPSSDALLADAGPDSAAGDDPASTQPESPIASGFGDLSQPFDPDSTTDSMGGNAPWGEGAGADGEVALAVFLPDGGAVTQGPMFLVDERGKAAEFVINRWTGAVQVSAVSSSEGAAAAPGVPRSTREPRGPTDRRRDR